MCDGILQVCKVCHSLTERTAGNNLFFRRNDSYLVPSEREKLPATDDFSVLKIAGECTMMAMKKLFLIACFALATSVACFGQTIPQSVIDHSINPRTFTDEMLDRDINQENIGETICRKGYTKTVRPSTVYTNGVKMKLLREAGLVEADASLYELDHIVPLALGGHPRKLSNLMLQPWEGKQGAKQKDRLERKMQNMV